MLNTVLVATALLAARANAGKGFTGQPVVAGYWPSYASQLLTPEQIQYEQFTHIDWFVASSTPTYDLDFGGVEDTIKPVVSKAHAAGVTVSLCIGGWDGSRYFSDLVANATGRAAYASQIKTYVDTYGFDGVDLDWEFPGTQGLGCNTIRPEDPDNFLAFLKVLRQKLGNDARLSAAVSVTAIKGADGNVYNRTGELANYLDYVTVMAYDIYGTGWSQTTGPVGQLYDTCASPEGQGVSGALGAKLWTDAGFPAKKILLGTPAYAYPYITASSQLATTSATDGSKKFSLAYQARTQDIPDGGVTSGQAGTDPCGAATAASPLWLFKELISTGKLSANASAGAGGYTRYFDACSDTPFLFNPTTRNFIAYDDPQSYAAKAAFARTHGLAGINMFDLTGDTQDSLLIKAARSQLIGAFNSTANSSDAPVASSSAAHRASVPWIMRALRTAIALAF